ncbi:MAG TPA: hypothetical protein VJT31_32695 [Rugosimonospora sp.]|nr:hypothetical protein [Rugosimonospora sp.]
MTDPAPISAAAPARPAGDSDATPVAPAVRIAMFGTLAYACGYNALTLTLFSGDTDMYFPWGTRPLTAATLGAAYAGALAMCLVALRATRWTSVRAVTAPITLVLVLVAVASVVERRSLRLTGGPVIAFVASYLWLLTHAALIVCVAAALWRQHRLCQRTTRHTSPAGPPARRSPGWPPTDQLMRRGGLGPAALRMPVALRAPLVACGLLALTAGGALWLRPNHAGWWPWPLTPIDARVLGGWAIAYGLGVLRSVREADLWRTAPGLTMVAVTGALAVVALIRYPHNVAWTGAGAYLGVLAVTGVAGALGLAAGGPWRSRNT